MRCTPALTELRRHLQAGAAAALFLSSALASVPAAFAEQPGGTDRTLSPYFLVRSDDPQVDRLPLKATSAEVHIAGVIADVTVTQVYKNEGRKPLEAIYVFPGSTHAAVYALTMTIGTRTIRAVIRERQQARAEYEQARAQGRTASLLEQQRPNVFQMNVANIMPGDEIKVCLSYTELLTPTEGVYEFVYPTVVGPRYSNQPATGAPETERWVENPYQHEGEAPTYGFDIKVTINAGMPIQRAACPSHRTSVRYDGPTSATVTLDPSERQGGNRDFILRYGLAGSQVESGLLLYHGKDGERFFLLMAEPPRRVTTSQIPPREYIFVVDVSGSMHGFPLEVSKKLLADLISHLRPTDSFNVLLFSGGSSVLSERSLPASPENVSLALRFIDRQQGGGGTELVPALNRAFALPRSEGTSRTVVIATDGYVTVEKEAFDLIRSNLDRSNVFAFGIGTAVNRFLIEGIARAGMGEPFVVARPENAPAQAERFRTYVTSPVLTQVKVEYRGFDAYDVQPPSVPDVLTERPVIVFGKWRGPASGHIVVHGLTGGQPYTETLDVGTVRPLRSNSALRYLWARHRIAVLGDYCKLQRDSEKIKEITSLGLAYNLLTDYTSFVAIDRTVRNTDGKVETVTQPLPLPQGVTDLAVGRPAGMAFGAASSVVGNGAVGGVQGGVGAKAVREEASVSEGLQGFYQSAPPLKSGVSSTDRSRATVAPTSEAAATWNRLSFAARTWLFPTATGPSTVTIALKPAAGRLIVAKVEAEGCLSRSDVERTIHAHLAEIKAYMEKVVAPGAGLVLTLSIRADGSVADARVIAKR